MKISEKMSQLQSWILENETDWSTICGQGTFPISESEYMRLHQFLVENNFEELTLVLLTTHFYAVENRLARNLKSLADILEQEIEKRDLL